MHSQKQCESNGAVYRPIAWLGPNVGLMLTTLNPPHTPISKNSNIRIHPHKLYMVYILYICTFESRNPTSAPFESGTKTATGPLAEIRRVQTAQNDELITAVQLPTNPPHEQCDSKTAAPGEGQKHCTAACLYIPVQTLIFSLFSPCIIRHQEPNKGRGSQATYSGSIFWVFVWVFFWV